MQTDATPVALPNVATCDADQLVNVSEVCRLKKAHGKLTTVRMASAVKHDFVRFVQPVIIFLLEKG